MQLHGGGGGGGDDHPDDADDDSEVVETDPEGRYLRYKGMVGRGKFKSCFRAFDTHLGIDVAWSKFNVKRVNDGAELAAVVRDIQTNLELEHPNIIKSFKCWEQDGCINLITELFTSGNLRQYRNNYKHLDLKAVKRMARQILRGLQYLHSMEPPITHGDLRCDKIYVNGNSGEIKIGDIGLATLLPYRAEAVSAQQQQQQQQHEAAEHGQQGSSQQQLSASPSSSPQPPLDRGGDIFAFGLCIIELLTLKQMDPLHCAGWRAEVDALADDEARAFILDCMKQPPPTADELLQHPWLQVYRKGTTLGEAQLGGGSGGGAAPGAVPAAPASSHNGGTSDPMMSSISSLGNASARSLQEAMLMASGTAAGGDMRQQRRSSGQQTAEPDLLPGPMDAERSSAGSAPITNVGKLRGEDYLFEFAGKVKNGVMHFRLVMTQAQTQEPPDAGTPPFMRTIDFVFDPEVDTAEKLASEISENFTLSPTDTEICAAALREWLAKENWPQALENGK